MGFFSRRRQFLQQALVLLSSVALLGAWSLPAAAQTAPVFSFKRIHTDLCNFDLRVPQIPTGQPINDLVIIIYGIFPGGVNDVVNTYPNPVWGKPTVQYIPGGLAAITDPRHNGFGFDQLIIRYGPGETARPGSLMHFGVHLRPCRWHVHVEAWWTFNGQRVARAWLCHIYKVRIPHFWVVRVVNPRAWDPEFPDKPLIFHGAQYFVPAPTKLPRLTDLLSDINPTQFGAEGWTPLREETSTLPVDPDMALSFFIPNPKDDPTPPVFQIQMEELAQGVGAPQSADQLPPLAIVTDRAAVELEADLNGDGAVGEPDFRLFRNQYGHSSPDEVP